VTNSLVVGSLDDLTTEWATAAVAAVDLESLPALGIS
jgi:hypothetical protein